LLRQKKVAKEKGKGEPITFCVWLAAGWLPAEGLTFLCFAKEK
jgi:hypothetical protein